jgi:hypothetical protein
MWIFRGRLAENLMGLSLLGAGTRILAAVLFNGFLRSRPRGVKDYIHT